MNEDFLSYVWLFRLYTGEPLLADGRPFFVENPGMLNKDSGPDFLGARIRIGEALWIGHAEIHVKSSDWYLHGHHDDPAYDTVILHVVHHHDREIRLNDGSIVPVFELCDRIGPELYTRYLQFMASAAAIPCTGILKVRKPPFPGQWLISLGLQRFMRKGRTLSYLQERLDADWHELFYVAFCRGFGNKVNDDVFEVLALKTPLHLIRKYTPDPMQLEALLFGQSGLLPEPGSVDHPYVHLLHQHYAHIAHAHQCEPLNASLWRFLRTRPSNFPTIRIAQLAALVKSFTEMNPLSVQDIRQWMNEATNIRVSGYWSEHYHFSKRSKKPLVSIGKESVERLVINGLLPPLLIYGELYKNHAYLTALMDLVSSFPPENNRIIAAWKGLGIHPSSALESQGLTELFNEYCRMKRCLDCRFGHDLLRDSVDTSRIVK